MKLLLMLFVVLSTCHAEVCKGALCDTRAQLAYDYMNSRFGEADSATSLWLTNSYDDQGRIWLERREHKLEELAKWADTLPPQDKDAYLGVIEHYEAGAKEAYAEWHTHELKDRQTAYEKHLRECAEAARKDSAKRPLPKPPESLLLKQ